MTENDQIRCRRVSHCSTITIYHIKLLRPLKSCYNWLGIAVTSSTQSRLCAIVPSEFHLFEPLKESLEGLKFNDNQDFAAAHVLNFFSITDRDFCATGVMTTRETLGTLCQLAKRHY